MSFNIKFSKAENKQKALAKIWWEWEDTKRPYTMYSLPEHDKKGLEHAVESLIKTFLVPKYLKHIKDGLIFIFNNQTGELLRKYQSGVQIYD